MDILVNNAGIAIYGGVEDMILDDIDALLDVNVRAAVLASAAAIAHIGAGGRIISIGSCLAERSVRRIHDLFDDEGGSHGLHA